MLVSMRSSALRGVQISGPRGRRLLFSVDPQPSGLELVNGTDNSTYPFYYEDADVCTPITVLLDFSHKYYIPFIILIGLVGNFLSCIVFLTTHLRMRSSSYYLAALSTADFGYLTVLLLVYLSNNAGLEFFNKPGWCQSLVYISSFCSTLSVWLIVAFTVERFIAVQYPLQRPQMCTVSRAKTIVLCLTIVATVSQSYYFVIAGMVKDATGSEMCEMLEQYHDAMNVINIIDTAVTLIGPFILIVVMNTMIARNLYLFRKRFQHGSLDECLYTDCAMFNRTITQSGCSNRRNMSQQSQQSKQSYVSRWSRRTKTSQVNDQLPRRIHIRTSGRNRVSTRNQQNITKMLLLISTVFIILNLPSYVIRLYIFFIFQLWKQRAPEMLWCMQQFVMMLYYTNFSINFLLYAMCGITFRRCLRQLIRNNFKILARRPCIPLRNAFRLPASSWLLLINNNHEDAGRRWHRISLPYGLYKNQQ